MSNETIISLLQNQLNDLELQLSQLQHRADSISSTINTLKSELENTATLNHDASLQAQAANELAQSALQNAQSAAAAVANGRNEINEFVSRTAQQIENLATKAQLAATQQVAQQPQPIVEVDEQTAADTQAALQAMVEDDADIEQAIYDVEPTPINEEPMSDEEQQAVVDDLELAHEAIASEPDHQEPEPENEVPTLPDEEPNQPILTDKINEEEAELQPTNDIEHSDQSSIIPKISDIKAGISIGDRFLFQRQLFKNSGELMNKTIAQLNTLSSYDEAMEYCSKHFDWDTESNAYELFTAVLRRRW